MKKNLLILLLFLFLGKMVFSQQNKLQKEINEQVWIPFIQSFGNGDDETFRSVHSKDVTRVLQDDNQVWGYDRYFQKVPDSIKARWNKWKKNIELRFIQRIAADGRAFETGYYKTTSTHVETGEVRTSIGKFHVLLRLENDQWKILMDADTREGASEESFRKALPMK